MPDAFTISRLTGMDLLDIETQESQLTWFGMPADITPEERTQLAMEPEAWCARHGERILACYGIAETFRGLQGSAWALLAKGLGPQHLPLTRDLRRMVTQCGLARVDMLARCTDVEPILAKLPDFDRAMLVDAAMAEPTPECRLGLLVGMEPVHVLRQYGAARESYMLFERIDPLAGSVLREAA